MENKFEHILASLSYKLQLDKIYVEVFIKSVELLVEIFKIQNRLIPKINIDGYNKMSFEFIVKDKSLYFYVNDSGWKITKYDHKNGYKQNLELNKELFEWLWTT